MLLTIHDETASGKILNGLTLDLLDETISVRELIRSRVYQEVQDYNRKRANQTQEFRGLVTPDDAEKTLNGVKLRTPRDIDWKKQFDKACESFERNGFFILVDDRQAESLDEMIALKHNSTVTFVKLMPLVGG